jgi:hypothetical protein
MPYVHGTRIVNDVEMQKLMKIIDKLGDRLLIFAEQYEKDDRKEIEFLHDLVAMGKYMAELPKEADFLMNMGTASDLMHNRIQVQLIAHYYHMGCGVTPKPTSCADKLET